MSKLKHWLVNPRMAWLWLVVRVYVGWVWLEAGWGKVTNSAWVGTGAGGAVKGFLTGALTKTAGEHPDVSDWYAWMIENIGLPGSFVISHLVAFGELAVGVALILGVFTGLAAFGGALMNMNFLLAGTVSSNPTLLLLEILLVSARRVAGRYGLDRFISKARHHQR